MDEKAHFVAVESGWLGGYPVGLLGCKDPKRLVRSVIAHGAAAEPAGRFVDVTTASGVHFEGQAYQTAKKYLIETMGSGVALFDYDNDGRLDIFFANGAL